MRAEIIRGQVGQEITDLVRAGWTPGMPAADVEELVRVSTAKVLAGLQPADAAAVGVG